MSRVAFVLVLLVITLGTMSSAQTVTLLLQEDVSSGLPTGITFTAIDSAKLSPDAPEPRRSPVRPNAATLARVLSLAIPMATLQLPR